MRKVPVAPAATAVGLLAVLLPSAAAAQPAPSNPPRQSWLVQTRIWTESKPRRRGPRAVIRQSPTGEVVLERVGEPQQESFIPPTYYDYPPSPFCQPADIVVEVRVHPEGSDAETEGQTAEVVQEATRPSSPASRLKRITRGLGSFFRPKSSEASVRPDDVDLSDLLSREFLIPVRGVDPERLHDSFLASRGEYAKHLAIDIGAPRGTPVLATTDGEIVRISRERRGGKSIYQRDSSGQYLLFYCHLSRYADGLEAGHKVRRGDLIGYVGSTGHVVGGPHLHFSITRLPEDDADFKKGLAINPYLLFLGGVP